MQYFTQILALAALANAAVFQRDATLEVTLVEVDHAVVKATVKNTGTAALNLLKYGSVFDEAPVEKLNVMAAGSRVAFEGVLRRVQTTDLKADTFYLLEAGATYETEINAAAVHTLSTGKYSVTAEGAIPYAAAGSTELTGQAVYYKSNTLEIPVDGDLAGKVKRAIPTLSERTVLQSGCSTAQRTATTRGLANCVTLARAAAASASSGSATKFSEYFKSTSASVRNTVSARLTAVANQCNSLTSGATKYYCSDPYGYCQSNVLAYTLPSSNIIVNCPLFYSALPALTRSCHAQDQATTTIHEMTHAPGVYSPGTQDNGYGYPAATALTSARAVANADSYALYANALYAGC